MTIKELTGWYPNKESHKVLIYAPSENREYFKGVISDIPEDILWLSVLSYSPRQSVEDTMVIYI